MLTVTRFSHFFVVEGGDRDEIEFVHQVSKRFEEWDVVKKAGRWERELKALFCVQGSYTHPYRFHIGAWPLFSTQLMARGWKAEDHLIIRDAPMYDYPNIDIKMRENFVPRENQLAFIEYLKQGPEQYSPITSGRDTHRKFVNLQTGKGKGITSMFAIEHYEGRVLVCVKPKYVSKWWLELKEKMELEDENFCFIGGDNPVTGKKQDAGKSLLNAIKTCGEENSPIKVYIASNATLRNWITDFETMPMEEYRSIYPIRPDQFCKRLSIAVRLIDELHEEYHCNFRIDLYTHVPISISMSATLVDKKPFMNSMYLLMHAKSERSPELEYDKICNVLEMHFKFKNPQKIRTKTYGRESYSHFEFEKSIMRHVPTKMAYFEFIDWALNETFFNHKDYKKGHKALIFCFSIDMCTELTKYLAMKHRGHSVARYVSIDSEDNLLKTEIVVTTYQNAGTGFDIKGLLAIVQTIAIGSDKANLQIIGRARPHDDRSVVPAFGFFACEDIPAQMRYAKEKKELLGPKALAYLQLDYHRAL